MNNFVTAKECEGYRKEIEGHAYEQDMKIILNTEFRLSFQKLYWIFLGAVVSGFIGVIIAIFTSKL